MLRAWLGLSYHTNPDHWMSLPSYNCSRHPHTAAFNFKILLRQLFDPRLLALCCLLGQMLRCRYIDASKGLAVSASNINIRHPVIALAAVKRRKLLLQSLKFFNKPIQSAPHLFYIHRSVVNLGLVKHLSIQCLIALASGLATLDGAQLARRFLSPPIDWKLLR